MQLPFACFTPQTEWTPPRPEQWPNFGRARGKVSFDLENNDERLKDDGKLKGLGPGCLREGFHIAGIGVKIEGEPGCYIPIGHKGGDNVENPEAALAWALDNAAQFEGSYVGAHSAYDLKWFRSRGINFSKVKRFWDVLIGDTLVYELHRRGDLDAMCERRGIPGKDKTLLLKACESFGLKKPLKEMWKLPARYVAPYNIADLEAPLRAFPLIEADLKAMDCLDLWDLETRLTPILVDMFMRGIKVNTDKLTRMEIWYRQQMQLVCDAIRHLTQRKLEITDFNKGALLGPLLEEVTGIKLPRSGEKGKGFKLDDATLSAYEDDHPLFKLVHRGRKLSTAYRFCPQTWEHLVKGRIHCSYNQVRSTEETLDSDMDMEMATKGARTGRMSCQNTNLTQQPARDEWAKDWRDIYEPEEGMDWWTADFSQQEPRITTAKAAAMDLPMARETSAAYLSDELLDNHAFMAKLTGLIRKKAKNIYLGLVYSMGEAKLCHQLKLPTRYCVAVGPYRDQQKHFFDEEWQASAFRQKCHEEQVRVFECAGTEGQKVLDTFHKRAPFLKMLSDLAKKKGRQYGVIHTILNRHVHLPMKADGSYDWIHACLNMYVQGSAADMSKLALVNTIEAIPDLFLQLQVHDSEGGSIEKGKPGRERAKEIGRIMRNSVKDKYMIYRVDLAMGPSWGREEDLCYEQYCIEDAKSSDEKYCPKHAPLPMAA